MSNINFTQAAADRTEQQALPHNNSESVNFGQNAVRQIANELPPSAIVNRYVLRSATQQASEQVHALEDPRLRNAANVIVSLGMGEWETNNTPPISLVPPHIDEQNQKTFERVISSSKDRLISLLEPRHFGLDHMMNKKDIKQKLYLIVRDQIGARTVPDDQMRSLIRTTAQGLLESMVHSPSV